MNPVTGEHIRLQPQLKSVMEGINIVLLLINIPGFRGNKESFYLKAETWDS